MAAPTHTVKREHPLLSGPEIQINEPNGIWNEIQRQREEYNVRMAAGLVLFLLKLVGIKSDRLMKI